MPRRDDETITGILKILDEEYESNIMEIVYNDKIDTQGIHFLRGKVQQSHALREKIRSFITEK